MSIEQKLIDELTAKLTEADAEVHALRRQQAELADTVAHGNGVIHHQASRMAEMRAIIEKHAEEMRGKVSDSWVFAAYFGLCVVSLAFFGVSCDAHNAHQYELTLHRELAKCVADADEIAEAHRCVVKGAARQTGAP